MKRSRGNQYIMLVTQVAMISISAALGISRLNEPPAELQRIDVHSNGRQNVKMSLR
jgi:hypothetical protein